jgi:FixJ family two-component response regulator
VPVRGVVGESPVGQYTVVTVSDNGSGIVPSILPTMPQMTGTELATRAMVLRPGLPVVLCVGFSKSVDEESALARGISRFIQKPVPKQELARALREVLERV